MSIGRIQKISRSLPEDVIYANDVDFTVLGTGDIDLVKGSIYQNGGMWDLIRWDLFSMEKLFGGISATSHPDTNARRPPLPSFSQSPRPFATPSRFANGHASMSSNSSAPFDTPDRSPSRLGLSEAEINSLLDSSHWQ